MERPLSAPSSEPLSEHPPFSATRTPLITLSRDELNAIALDAIKARVALIDTAGMVVMTNSAWRGLYAMDDGVATHPSASIGANYLDACRSGALFDAAIGEAVCAGLRAVLSGHAPSFTIDHERRSGDGSHWYRLFATPLSGQFEGALIQQYDITSERTAREAAGERDADIAAVVEKARCLVWHSIVRRTENPRFLSWEIRFPALAAAKRLIPIELRPEETYGQAFYRCRNQEDKEREDDKICAAIRAGRNYDYEFRIDVRGETRWMHEYVQVETLIPDEKWSAVGVCIDVTELRRTDERLGALYGIVADAELSHEARIHQLMELGCAAFNLPFAFLGETAAGKYTIEQAICPSMQFAPGFSVDLGATFCEETVRRDQVFALERVTGTPWCSHRAYDTFGSEVYFGTPVRMTGRVFGTLCFADSTARIEPFSSSDYEFLRLLGQCVSTELTRRHAANALKESEARFRMLVDSMPALVWMLDADRKPTFVSRRWDDFVGSENRAAVFARSMSLLHPEDRPDYERVWEEIVERREAFQLEARFRRADGEYRTLLNVGIPRYLADGEFLGWIGVSTDITEQKAIRTAMFESSKLESLGRLAGGIAHDFNNLLMAIMGYTNLAQREIEQNESAVGHLEHVITASERAAELTRQLLMYARKQVVPFHTLNLNTVIRNMTPLLQHTVGGSRKLILTLSDDLYDVCANESQIGQILMNLVVNACDAMPDGGRVTIRTNNVQLDCAYTSLHAELKPGEYALLTVSDTGQGMTLDVQQRIFEPFFTTKGPGKGTGLGLATCFGIVQQNRGHIRVDSAPGQGATFYIYLPRHCANARQEPAQGQPVLETSRKGVILVVDDDAMVRDIMARILSANGYSVLQASNGAQALERFATDGDRIDLVITDLTMPIIGGTELVRLLRERDHMPKVVFVSGDPHAHAAADPASSVLLAKPFSSEQLMDVVHRVLETGGSLPLRANSKPGA